MELLRVSARSLRKIGSLRESVSISSLKQQHVHSLYPGHIKTSFFEKLWMTATASYLVYKRPQRGDLVALLTETTALPFFLNALRNRMLEDATGRRILRERPRMTSASLNLEVLRLLPENTLGRQYLLWLEEENVSPDTRAQTHFIDDEELAYVIQRYRECHDFYHCILGIPTNLIGEITVKYFEWFNMGLPVAALGSTLKTLGLPFSQQKLLVESLIPWAYKSGTNCKSMINVYWEEEFSKNTNSFLNSLEVERCPIDLSVFTKKRKQ